jgi:hypothetical protein
MKDSFKKVALLVVGLMSGIQSFALSGGAIAGITLGTAAAVTLVGVGIHKHREKKRDRNRNSDTNSRKEMGKKKSSYEDKEFKSTTPTKKELKHQIAENKREQKKHKRALHKLERTGKDSTSEAMKHKGIIASLESDLKGLKSKLESL